MACVTPAAAAIDVVRAPVETFGQELLLGSRQNRLLLGFCRFCHGSVIY